jgi:uncharacterized delta-60 repeat protein
MTFTTWLRGLRSARDSRAGARNRGRGAPRGAGPRFRPQLEPMEDRCLLSGGVLDPTFGSGGLVTTAIGSYARAFAVATYPNGGTANDGKIVAAGDVYPSTGNTKTEYMEVVRYNRDGTLDRTFGGSGAVMTMPGAALAVQVQPDGKVVAAGFSGSHYVIARYNADGTLDTTFGSAGKVITNVGKPGASSSDVATAVVLQADGKIVVAGWTNPTHTTYEDLFLARFYANGTPDASFGRYAPGGTFTTRFTAPLEDSYTNSPVTLAIDRGTEPQGPHSGKFVVGCALQTGESIVARYTVNGVPDEGGFGVGTGHPGYVMVSGFVNPVRGVRVAVQADDRIAVAGDLTAGSIGLDRLNPDGSPDTSFGSGGVEVTSPPPNGDAYFARSVMVQADGKIAVAGDQKSNTSGAHSFMVARYNTNGSLDTSFGVNGIATGGNLGGNGFVGGVALEPDGRIVEAGAFYSSNGSTDSFSLARFLATGPQIGSFTASPNPATAGGSVALTASNITDANPGAAVTQVAFYVQVNGNNTLLGYGTQTSPGVWTFAYTVNLAPGTYTLFAQAEDSYGAFGDPLAITLTVI